MESERNSKPGAGIPCEGETCERKEDNGPSWRALIVSVLAAVVLSIGATLLLGGMGGLTGRGASGPCGGGACVPGRAGAGFDEKVFRDERNGALAADGASRSAAASDAVGRTPVAKVSSEERRDR